MLPFISLYRCSHTSPRNTSVSRKISTLSANQIDHGNKFHYAVIGNCKHVFQTRREILRLIWHPKDGSTIGSQSDDLLLTSHLD